MYPIMTELFTNVVRHMHGTFLLGSKIRLRVEELECQGLLLGCEWDEN